MSIAAPPKSLSDPALKARLQDLRRTDNVTNWAYLLAVYLYLAAVIGVVVLGFHLWHGVQSLMQSLGLRDSRYAALIRGVGLTLAVVLGAGFAAFPVVFAVLGTSWFKS